MKLFALMGLILLLMLASTGASLAQTATPSAATPLMLDKGAQGTLNSSGERVTYRFEIPQDKDVVIEFAADHIVTPIYCTEVTTTTPLKDARECSHESGGGDGDGAVASTLYFPTDDDIETKQTVDLTLIRPSTVSAVAAYTLTPHLITPQPLALGKSSHSAPSATEKFQTYTLQIDRASPRTLEAEATAGDGNFLWVAYQPDLPDSSTFGQPKRITPQELDSATAPVDSDIEDLNLSYLGGNNFRLLVTARVDYSLNNALIEEPPALEAGQVLPVLVSYREPVKTVRLETANAGNILIGAVLTYGSSADVEIYTRVDPGGVEVTLDHSTQTSSSTSLFLPDSQQDRLVVIQLPAVYTRSQIVVNVKWQLEK